jgi:MOSC domain-containing protein YiiM
MDDAGFIRRFRDARRPGVYLRVLRPGQIGPGDEVTLQRAAAGAMTVLELQDLFYDKRISADAIERALRQPIDIRSRRDFERRLARK